MMDKHLSTISRRLILAALLVAGCAGQARAVSFTCVQAGPTTWIYNLTFDPEDNYSIFQGTTTITLSGLSGVTQAFAPTSTDFTGSAAMVNLAWSPSVLNGGTTVVWSHTGGGTGNFGVPKHVNGFSITSGAPAGVVSISTSGVSRDMDNPLPGGTFNVDISGTVIGPSGTQASTGSLAQIASGQGWDTSLTLVSLGPTAFPAALSFFADQTGSPLSLPFTYPQGALAATSEIG